MGAEPTIVAASAAYRSIGRGPYDVKPGAVMEQTLRLTGKSCPRLCYLGTATGDSLPGLQMFYGAFAGRDDVVASHLSLFSMPNVDDVAAHLLSQDAVWVGGGSVANLLAVWRVHGLDEIFREAWQRGVVLAGVSAGSLCWHVGGTTDSYGPDLRCVDDGLGLVPYANGVHYDSEVQRRPLLHRLVGDGTLPTAYATDDGVALVYRGTELVEVIAETPGVAGYVVERVGAGEVRETRLEPRLLPSVG
jgi:peptidase E